MGLCGYNLTNTEPLEAITGRTYRGDGTKRLVLWAHGHNTGANTYLQAWGNTDGEYATLAALTNLGLPIITPQCAQDNWGNDAGQTKLSDARTWGASGFLAAKTDKVILCGLSMGGLLALNWARANPTLVACICLFYPVVNLVAVHDATGGATDFSSFINTAYANLTGYNAAKATHDPAQNASSYTGVPIYLGMSDSDTVVGTANQTSFINAVGGSTLTQRVYAGAGHGDMSQVNAAEVASFVSQYA